MAINKNKMKINEKKKKPFRKIADNLYRKTINKGEIKW